MSAEGTETEYARVGRRYHLVMGEPVYVGQPEVALCGTVFVRGTAQPDNLPLCYDCHSREAERLRFLANEMLDDANEMTLALLRQPSRTPKSGA